MKRMIACTPKELISMNKEEFLAGIKASEGRTICAYVCPAAPNMIESVSNLEACASFGADYINFHGFNPRNLTMPGLLSKDRVVDDPYMELGMTAGKGWSVSELKELVGRPIGTSLFAYGDRYVKGILEEAKYSRENFRFLLQNNYDFIDIAGIYPYEIANAVKDARENFGENVIIEAGVPHASDDPDERTEIPYNLRDIITPDMVRAIAQAGADIIDIPACGVEPGFTIEYVAKLIDVIHEENKLASVSITHSIEGSSDMVIQKISIDNKMAGTDIFTLYGAGLYEGMAFPETIMALCIAVKGRRYTYRRMCQSPNR